MITMLTADDVLPANDRLTQYGDGCFTTMCAKNGHIELLARHLGRLRDACQRLAIDFSQWSLLHQGLIDAVSPGVDKVVKVIISRGTGGRGYGTSAVSKPQAYIMFSTMPPHYISQRNQGISVAISNVQLGHQPLLAGIKHCNRLEQILIKNESQNMEVDDVLVKDIQQNVIESSAGNLFYRVKDTWYTPNLVLCGVSGVMRNYILDLMFEHKINVLEHDVGIDELVCADEVFICNSLMKIVPVRTMQVENKTIDFQIDSRNFSSWFAHNQNEVSLHG